MLEKLKASQLRISDFFSKRATLGFALGLVLLNLSGCSIFSQDAEDGRTPAKLETVTSTLSIQTLWKTNVGNDAEGLGYGLQPIVKDGFIYLAGSKGVVRALNAENGSVLWSTSTGVVLSAGPGIGGQRVVVGSNNGDVIALDTKSGAELWRAKVDGEILTAPGVGIEQVAVRSANGDLNALSASSGSILWMSEREVPRLALRGSSAPLVTSGVILSGSDAGKLSSYSALDGSVLWERLLGLPRGTTELDRMVDIDGKIELNDTHLFAVGYNSRLAKLDARSGNMLWSKEYSSSTGVGLGWKNVYLSTTDSHVLAVDQESGSEVWKIEDYQYRELSVPVATGKAVVLGDLEGYVHFLSPDDGSTLARERVSKSAIRVPPVSANGIVYVQADDGKVVAFKINE